LNVADPGRDPQRLPHCRQSRANSGRLAVPRHLASFPRERRSRNTRPRRSAAKLSSAGDKPVPAPSSITISTASPCPHSCSRKHSASRMAPARVRNGELMPAPRQIVQPRGSLTTLSVCFANDASQRLGFGSQLAWTDPKRLAPDQPATAPDPASTLRCQPRGRARGSAGAVRTARRCGICRPDERWRLAGPSRPGSRRSALPRRLEACRSRRSSAHCGGSIPPARPRSR